MTESLTPIVFQTSEDDEIMEVTSSSENWNEYVFSNGDKLKVKSVMLEIRRSKTQKDTDGNPMLFMKAQLITNVQKSTSEKKRTKSGGKGGGK
jgi:hypothetical protein